MITVPAGRVPIMNDDGSIVACGNRVVYEVRGGIVTPVPGDGVRYPCGFNGDQVVVSREGVNAAGQAIRFLENSPSPVPPEQNPGWHPTRAVAGGHVVSSVGGRHFVDGVSQEHTYARPFADIDDFEHTGTFYLHPSTDTVPWAPTVRRILAPGVARLELALDVTGWHPDHDWLQNGRVFRSPDDRAWIFGNQHGVATLFTPAGIVRIPGEGACAVSWKDLEAWLWTCRIDGAQPIVLARRMADVLAQGASAPAIIRRGMAFDSLEVRLAPGGTAWRVASYISGSDGTTQIGDDIPVDGPLEIFVPAAPPLPELRVPALPPIALGWLGGNNAAPGFIAGGDDTTGRPQIEGCKQNGDPWPCNESLLWFEWLSPYESKAPALELAHAKNRALRTGAAMVMYCDRERYTEEMRTSCLALAREGYGVIPQLCGYPDNPSDTADIVLGRLHDDYVLLEPDFDVLALDLAGYTQTNFWPAALVGEITDRVLNEFLPAHPKVRLITWFGWERRLEPMLMQTWLQPYIAAVMQAATAVSRSAFPRSARLPATPAPPPAPSTAAPTKPAGVRPPGTRPPQRPSSTRPTVAVAVGGGILAAVLAWLTRKKS
jgi:hypothetical protein